MKLFLLFLTALTFFNCTKDSIDMQIYLYEKGKKSKLDNKSLNLPEISGLLNSMIINSDEFMRLYMDEDRFEYLEKEESAVEFVLEKETVIVFSQLGELKFKRVLIPLSGDFAGNEKSANITLFIGDDKYFPEPINNKNGYSDLAKLKLEIEKATK